VVAGPVMVVTMLAAAGCMSGDGKDYDISPIFPLTADKCAKYNGTTDGEGIMAHCWVTKQDCERAASDWRTAMQNIPDAIQFTC
jgi:hypothetical protein